MPEAKRSDTSGARTRGGSEESGIDSGTMRAAIIAGAWRRRQSFASRRSSVITCKITG